MQRCLLFSLPVLSGVLLLLSLPGPAGAQASMPGPPVVCYGSPVTRLIHHVPGRSAARLQQPSVALDIIFQDFPTAAIVPFQQAVDQWTTLLRSPVPIHILAVWATLPGNALASTKATKLYRGFTGATRPDAWYPVALAEKRVGHDLNGPGEADISITINATGNWYLGTDGNTPALQTDLFSVVLHEVAHGLGFVSAAGVSDSTGSLRDSGYLLIYDLLLASKAGVATAVYADPSPALLTQFTSDNLYLRSPASQTGNPPGLPKVFAPPFFVAGGSLSHLDEATYPPGDPDALMTPYFANGESVHTTGSILPGVLADLGWADSSDPVGEPLVYPNPSAGLVTIQWPLYTGPLALRVSDLSGKIVRVADGEVTDGSPVQLNLTTLPNGLYVLVIATPAVQRHRKLILVR